MISLGTLLGGAKTNRCTWSLLTTPLRISISNACQVWRIGSLTFRPTSPLGTWYRYFV